MEKSSSSRGGSHEVDATENIGANGNSALGEDGEGLEDVENAEDGADLEDVGNAEEIEDAEDIKEEPYSDTYLPYDQVKKEEPDDGPYDKRIPELGEINDMFDDVDGPEYVDLDYEGIAEVDGVDCFVCEEFKIRQVPKPVIVTRPLYQLFDCIVSEHIILDPDYQRDVVWDEGREALLISSILTGYFIPPIIFNCVQRQVELPDGTEQMQHKRICVDGKQRLTSVWKFMTGQIGFFDSNKPQKKWYFCHPTVDVPHPNVNRNILPNAVKEFFKNQAFCCYEYDELSQDTEETMFQLVQKGIALTPAEKMRAMSSEWATFAKEYEDRYPTVINLSKQNRASGFRLILTIFSMVMEVLGIKKRKVNAAAAELGPTLQASTASLSRLLADKDGIDSALKLRFQTVFDKYQTLVRLSSTELSSNRWKIDRDSAFDPAPIYLRSREVDHGRSFSPLELVGSAVLITIHAEKHTDEELLEDIKWMRHYLRTRQKDLRVNAACWRITWEFISVELNLRRSGKHSSPAFMTHAAARALARKKSIARASLPAAKKKAATKPKAKKPKAKPKPASRPTASKPKPKRAAPAEIPERLFPNLPRRGASTVRVEIPAHGGENFSESDPDATLSELEDLSEPEEEDEDFLESGGSQNRVVRVSEEIDTEAGLGSSKRTRSVQLPVPETKRARLS